MNRQGRGCYPTTRWLVVAFLLLFATPGHVEEPSGTVVVEQVSIAFIASGQIGSGTLSFRGKEYPFQIGGLGIGGIGFSRISATGEVYGLERLEDFQGAYVQGRYGAVAGTSSVGELWLQNDQGVRLGLRSQRQGIALSLGGDAVYVNLK